MMEVVWVLIFDVLKMVENLHIQDLKKKKKNHKHLDMVVLEDYDDIHLLVDWRMEDIVVVLLMEE